MKALILTVGSQGDVRPFVALGERLRRAGHEVTLVAPRLFRPLAAACGLPYTPLDLDMSRVGEVLGDSHGARQFVRFARAMGRMAGDALPGVPDEADIVIHHPVLPVGQHLAERLGVPAVMAPPLPAFLPTAEFCSPVWSTTARLPKAVNRASYRVSSFVTTRGARREIDRWRRDVLGLRARAGRHDPLHGAAAVLHSFSPQVLAPPADWPAHAHVTGYWFTETPAEWAPPRKLAAFLDAGPPPVYIGFGSMPMSDPSALAAEVRRTVDRLGTRAIVASGYQGLKGLTSDETVLTIRHAPHDWLFDRVSAVVHHGGAGTTGAAAAAGRPQVICPVGVDQPFWAKRMRDLGVAADAPPLRALDARSLERSLGRALHDPGVRSRATDLGHRIRAEDGLGTAVTLLEQLVPQGALR